MPAHIAIQHISYQWGTSVVGKMPTLRRLYHQYLYLIYLQSAVLSIVYCLTSDPYFPYQNAPQKALSFQTAKSLGLNL
ncbi:MAG: hypothetical protein F6K34_09345 [Okeania sp. SIO4D6]|nr:hypothetical protein [Okeania sp. SIO4D6]